MIRSAAILLILLNLGNVAADSLSLPVPGSALGLVALTLIFAVSGGPDRGSEELFDISAPYFPLFFVPAAVGVVASFDILLVVWAYVLVAIIAGTAITLLVTALAFQFLQHRIAQEAQV